MTSYATSADGTRIAFERLGDGPPMIVVGGILCDRQTTQPLAERLAEHLSVINFDRRGRALSGSASPGFFQETAARIAELLPNGQHLVLERQDHGASADAVAPVVAECVA